VEVRASANVNENAILTTSESASPAARVREKMCEHASVSNRPVHRVNDPSADDHYALHANAPSENVHQRASGNARVSDCARPVKLSA
jgi:hypothetical protein